MLGGVYGFYFKKQQTNSVPELRTKLLALTQEIMDGTMDADIIEKSLVQIDKAYGVSRITKEMKKCGIAGNEYETCVDKVFNRVLYYAAIESSLQYFYSEIEDYTFADTDPIVDIFMKDEPVIENLGDFLVSYQFKSGKPNLGKVRELFKAQYNRLLANYLADRIFDYVSSVALNIKLNKVKTNDFHKLNLPKNEAWDYILDMRGDDTGLVTFKIKVFYYRLPIIMNIKIKEDLNNVTGGCDADGNCQVKLDLDKFSYEDGQWFYEALKDEE